MGQITVLGTMLKACAAANDTYDPPAFFNSHAKSLVVMNDDPDQLIVVLRTLMASPQYANPTKEPKDWVAQSALTGAAGGRAGAVSVGPAVATSVVSMGKDGKGGKGASTNKKKVASQRGKGKTAAFDEEGA